MPARIDTIIISTQHDPVIGTETDNNRIQKIISEDLKKYVIEPVFKMTELNLMHQQIPH